MVNENKTTTQETQSTQKGKNRSYVLGLCVVAMIVVYLCLKVFSLQQNAAAEIFEPQVLTATNERPEYAENKVVNPEIVAAVSEAEARYARLCDKNAEEMRDYFKSQSSEIAKIEESDFADVASAYLSMMYAVAQNLLNEQVDIAYAEKTAEARSLVALDKEVYESMLQ